MTGSTKEFLSKKSSFCVKFKLYISTTGCVFTVTQLHRILVSCHVNRTRQ